VEPLIQIEQKRKVLQLATMEPFKEPARPLSHWDFVLKEMRWMAVDFTEASAVLQKFCCAHPALPDAYHLAVHLRLPAQLVRLAQHAQMHLAHKPVNRLLFLSFSCLLLV